jgi:hypothetical protein
VDVLAGIITILIFHIQVSDAEVDVLAGIITILIFHIQVSDAEVDVLAGIIYAFQNAVCCRYQTRAAAKLFTSFMFLFCPLFCTLTSEDLAV